MAGECPQCRVALIVVKANEMQAQACHACGGLWLSWAAVDRVMRLLDDTSLAIGQAADDIAEAPFPDHRASPPCPECGRPMHTVINPTSKIEVDNCDEHGSWYDRGELRALVRELLARRSTPVSLPKDFHERLALTPAELEERLREEYAAERVELARRRSAVKRLSAVDAAGAEAEGAAIAAGIEIGFTLLGALISSVDHRR